MNSETLIELAHHAQIKAYNSNEVVIEQGNPCRELLLLIEGEVQLQSDRNSSEVIVKTLLPCQILTELNLLDSNEYLGTIIATAPGTRILVINVDTFNDLLCQDAGFARRVLEMESRRLQQLI
jgi:CRP-like cAMP-binding protein